MTFAHVYSVDCGEQCIVLVVSENEKLSRKKM